MPKGDRFTKKEHYVPKVYLKGFSEIKLESKKAFIWEFDLESTIKASIQVNTNDVCQEKNLYELRDKEGRIISQNAIENTFGKFETRVSKIIGAIKHKSENERCLEQGGILSDEEINFLIIFMTMIEYRDAETINAGVKFLKNQNPCFDEITARNFTLMNLLPIGNDSEWNNNTIIKSALANYSNMGFQIGVASEDLIITSDRPVIKWLSHENVLCHRPQAVAFPLTSRLVLYLFPEEICPPQISNCFFKLSEEQVKDVQENVVVNARRWIFSRKPLTEAQMRMVMDAKSRVKNQ